MGLQTFEKIENSFLRRWKAHFLLQFLNKAGKKRVASGFYGEFGRLRGYCGKECAAENAGGGYNNGRRFLQQGKMALFFAAKP